ncbi:precorrin-3B C17-methyltransferase domain protein [Synechococcus sp. PCC 7335]|uniref:precorrin-3B C(17)-methyltransferase n=1 Tax=Synechococcus sp. (strain ATCC 29403 / PCC 7335) TaxID=91464 RepID=UPI00017EB51A|nr:precorrin-3B C(17)-methyltransferase [Synechococcus sp. PCC 7335]EDX83643.1 precorrin-3B C17-methyltransferase domain protein [Synechococcus sp. PCC 7335]
MSSIAAITTTPSGLRCLAPLCEGPLPEAANRGGTRLAQLWISPSLQQEAATLGLSYRVYETSLSAFLQAHWQAYDGFVFCLASGAVVRLIAPLLTDKSIDPAIVVVDQGGKVAISLCGGHQGGGDRLTQRISRLLDAQPILTGATNDLALPAVDTLGEPFGWKKGTGDWLGVSSAIARQAPVQVIQEAGTDLWRKQLPELHPFQFDFPEFEDRNRQLAPQARIWISPTVRTFSADALIPKVQWHPRVLWLGIGCERGTDKALIAHAIEKVCTENHYSVDAIAGVATLSLKADEVGLLELTQDQNWPLKCFDAATLKTVNVPNPSKVVEQVVQTPSVAEAAALTAADSTQLQVQKQVVKKAGLTGAVTIAIAQAQSEYTGRDGKLELVGTGPGSLSQISPAAKAAITNADVVIGYALYIDLIRPLLRPNQIVESLPITQERQRAERAIALARWGLTVAVISSGDCGIYGMAGLVLEQLQATGWNGSTPKVQVFPGISALQSAAAKVGAPLMHDFCAISLSDLLTPWPVIQRRLQVAAEADFVVALYNPKSKIRTQQIVFARDYFLQHRDPETPVALARSLYRPDEHIILTNLQEMFNHPIDMLTTVIIGNRSSQNYKGWFITPRGYLDSRPQERLPEVI